MDHSNHMHHGSHTGHGNHMDHSSHMGHGSHMNHGDHSSLDFTTVCMHFYNSSKVHLLFDGWDPDSKWTYFGCLVAVFFIAFCAEGLCILRDHIDRSTTATIKQTQKGLFSGRIWQSVCFFFQLMASYLMMLAIMSFNTGVFIAAMLGLGTAYFSIGFRAS